MMIKLGKILPSLCLILCGIQMSLGKPPDAEAAKLFPTFRTIISKLQTNTVVEVSEIDFIKKAIATKDPVLVSLAAWCVLLIEPQDRQLDESLQRMEVQVEEMPRAFIKIAQAHQGLRRESLSKRKDQWKSLTRDANPYVRLEAVKQLIKVDASSGRTELDKLLADKSALVARHASSILKRLDPAVEHDRPIPFSDERYEVVLSLVKSARDD
jgi:hypothetical protein